MDYLIVGSGPAGLRPAYFLERIGRDYPILEAGSQPGPSSRSIDVQVLRLRRELEFDSSAPQLVQTERGVGYLFALSVERQ